MIEHLGDLLRLSLESKDRQEVPLAEEMAFLDPVLYVPDLDEGFLSLKGASRMMGFAKLSGMEDMLEEFILVGVPLKWEGVSDWVRKRLFDLTPTDVEA